MDKVHSLNFIDLFAGAGGLSEGFIRAGYTPLAHIEKDKYACDTLRTRAAFHYLKNTNRLDIYKKYLYEKQEKEDGSKLWNQVPNWVTDAVIQSEIGEKTIESIFEKVDALIGGKQVDIIIGGPPCQAYSIVGRARVGKTIENDPRNDLYKFFIMFLERYKPKMFIFENVPGMLSAKSGTVWGDFRRALVKAEYKAEYNVMDTSKYGVLQIRKRWIIVGRRFLFGNPHVFYPYLEEEENKYQVLNDLFSDLPERKNGEGQLCVPVAYTKPLSEMAYLEKSGIRNNAFQFTTQHIARPQNANDRFIYKLAIDKWVNEGIRLSYLDIPTENQTQKNKDSFLNRFRVVAPFGKSHTVVAHIAMDGHYYIYPKINPTIENVRSITVREAARIQSFPDDYYFEGSRTAAFRQIGNAVPDKINKFKKMAA